MAIVGEYKPDTAYDLKSEVSFGKNVEISHGNMQFKVKRGGIITPYQTLICKYYHVLSKYIKERTFTEEECRKYYQKPILLSKDLYGTPELWSGLLYINNMVSVANFNKRTIKVFTNDIIGVLEEIMTICNDDLETNKNECYYED